MIADRALKFGKDLAKFIQPEFRRRPAVEYRKRGRYFSDQLAEAPPTVSSPLAACGGARNRGQSQRCGRRGWIRAGDAPGSKRGVQRHRGPQADASQM